MYRLSTNLRIIVIFSLRVDGVRGIVRLLKVLDLRYVYIIHFSIPYANLIIYTAKRILLPAAPPPLRILQHKPLQGDASNLRGVHLTALAAHHAQSAPAVLPSAPLPYSKCCAASIRSTRGSLRKTPQRGRSSMWDCAHG